MHSKVPGRKIQQPGVFSEPLRGSLEIGKSHSLLSNPNNAIRIDFRHKSSLSAQFAQKHSPLPQKNRCFS
jgi:hypothetical protein